MKGGDKIRAWRPDVSDDTCIALAMLHGATMIESPADEYQWLVWHECESTPIRGQGGAGGWTRGDACRRYVKRHKLLGK